MSCKDRAATNLKEMSSPQTASATNEAVSRYDREEITACLHDFYTFLATLPWIDPSDVLTAPSEGWPNIVHPSFGDCMKKNDVVIELLRRLPYLRMDNARGQEYAIAYSTFPCDYRRDYFQPSSIESAFAHGDHPYEVPETSGREFAFPEWTVPLTFGKNHGDYLILDTSDGELRFFSSHFLPSLSSEARFPAIL